MSSSRPAALARRGKQEDGAVTATSSPALSHCPSRPWVEAEQPEAPALPVVPELPEVPVELPVELPPEPELLSPEAVHR